MNTLMSINNKFFKNSSAANWDSLWKRLDHEKIINGFELYVDIASQEDMDYSKKIISQFKKNNWIAQLHGIDLENYKLKHGKDFNYLLDSYLQLTKNLDEKTIITFHPIIRKNVPKIDSLIETYTSIYEICNLIKTYNYPFEICIENLNKLNGIKRFNVFELSPLLEIENLFICWDIGHEVADNICEYNLHKLLFNKVKNIHLHDIGDSDHYPFYFGKTDYEKAISFLKENEYKNGIVLEIALDFLKGNNFDEKIEELYSFIQNKMNPLL